MSGLKELRNRIASVKSTQKITRAMQMVAASKLRRAQESVESSGPYAERMENVLISVSSNLQSAEGSGNLLTGNGKKSTYLLVVATSERGLCGGFNSSIVRKVRADIEMLNKESKTIKILCIGKKGRDILRREFSNLILETIDLGDVKNISYNDVVPISKKIIEYFNNDEFDICNFYFNKFVSVIVQDVQTNQLIPANINSSKDDSSSNLNSSSDIGDAVYDFEPDEDEILEFLLPKNLTVQLFQGLLENSASEQGARMTAMDNATRNAGEMIDELTLSYNRTRQAVITSELIEIISGAEAL